jgi:hypothetical protein
MAQACSDAGCDRGVSYGVRFGQDFDVSYPEPTGYICRTSVEQEQLTGNADLPQRAIDMGDWEIAIRLPEGTVMGGSSITIQPRPSLTLGWC